MRIFIFALLVVALSPQGQAVSSNGFDVKTGLWEMALQHSMEGVEMPTLSEEELALIPEAQRAQIQRMTSGNLGTSRYCITAEDLVSHTAFSRGKNKKCTHTLVSSSSSKVVVNFVCTGKNAAHGNITVNRIDDEHTKGTIKSVTKEGDNDVESTLTFDSKYVASDCGDTD